jgi:arylsulfatase A-like enzyme
VQFVDAQVGLLLDHVDRAARLDNTVIVVVSDHGEEFLERGHWGHVEINLHDEIIKVPLLIKLPGGSQARTIEHQVRTLDIMPTLVDLCGIPEPGGMLGESLRPLWTQSSQEQERIAICERWREQSHMIAVRTSSHKYIWDSQEPENPTLYDLVNDPDERKDVRAEQPEIAGSLSRHVNGQLARMRSTWRGGSSEVDEDEAVVARLKDLGYIE